ncbi:G protein-regulated inducer of neurite outgrowth 1 [Varanus komodoensis]|nr:G protein-regulated inducer of neurite outgrowth 1 [Varanus komodoensis]
MKDVLGLGGPLAPWLIDCVWSPPCEACRIAWPEPCLDMGSAKELETLQVLKQELAPEDAPSPSPPCSQENGSCLQSIQCSGGGDLTMRNCCVNDLGAKDSSREGSMVDNAKQGEKAPGADATPSTDHAAARDSVALKDAVAGTSALGGEGEKAACRELQHNSWQGLSSAEPPASSAITDSALDRKASPVAGEACRRLPAESCLKGANKDLSGAPASLKHVAFIEPTKHKAGAESTQAGEAAFSKESATLPACLQNTSQERPCASEGDVCEATGGLNEGRGDPLASEATQKSLPKPPVAETTSGKLGELVTERDRRDPGGGMRSPPLDSSTVLLAATPQGMSGESLTSPGAATKEAGGLREAAPSSTQDQARAQEQATAEAAIATVSEEPVVDVEMRPEAVLTKACSVEVTPPQQDAGTQAGHRVSLVSIAISPINPPDGSTAFSFHTGGLGPPTSLKSPSPEQKPAKKDVEMQVSIPVETRSVATGPMTPVTKSPQASYPEVHVKGAQEEAPEPVREVSWDEKGMTWEVYGASMEVEVLGMAIQKHLEKQIEEHGRQMVMTPQSTRSSSIKGPPHKGEIKRQPSMFRALLQNVRRPRCCSRGGPAVE